MKNKQYIGFLVISKYSTEEIKSYFLKIYEFYLKDEDFNINLIDSYRKIYKKREEKNLIVSSMLEILQILNNENYPIVFIEDNHLEFKKKLENTDIIFTYNIDLKIDLLKLEKKLNIIDIKKTFDLSIDEIISEIECNKNEILTESQLLFILFSFILKRLKKMDEKLLDILIKGDK